MPHVQQQNGACYQTYSGRISRQSQLFKNTTLLPFLFSIQTETATADMAWSLSLLSLVQAGEWTVKCCIVRAMVD